MQPPFFNDTNCVSMTHERLSLLIPHLRTKHCWQNYVDYYKCVNAKGEDFRPCKQVHKLFPPPTLDTCGIDSSFAVPHKLKIELCFARSIYSISNRRVIQFFSAFRALCPKAWTDRWDTQRGACSNIRCRA